MNIKWSYRIAINKIKSRGLRWIIQSNYKWLRSKNSKNKEYELWAFSFSLTNRANEYWIVWRFFEKSLNYKIFMGNKKRHNRKW